MAYGNEVKKASQTLKYMNHTKNSSPPRLNRERWQHIATAWNAKGQSAAESMTILTSDFDKQVLGQLKSSINPFS